MRLLASIGGLVCMIGLAIFAYGWFGPRHGDGQGDLGVALLGLAIFGASVVVSIIASVSAALIQSKSK
jgi:hypothetical protein